MDIIEQYKLVPQLRCLKDTLLFNFRYEILSRREVDLYYLLRLVQYSRGIEFPQAREETIILWKLFREELLSLYCLVDPASVLLKDLQGIFLEARKLPPIDEIKNKLLASETLQRLIKEGKRINYDLVSQSVEYAAEVDYHRAKDVTNELWRNFSDELRPLFSLVDPKDAPPEVKDIFVAARKQMNLV